MQNEKGNGEIGIIALLAGAAALVWKAGLALGLSAAASGCMQITGAKTIDLWGAKFEANNGIEVSAGVQQFDNVQNVRGINNYDTTVTRKQNVNP